MTINMKRSTWFGLWLGLCLFACDDASEPAPLQGFDATRFASMDLGTPSSDMHHLRDQRIPTDQTHRDMHLAPWDVGISQTDAQPQTDSGPQCSTLCISSSITWGRVGGLTPYDLIYSISPCRTQEVRIDSFAAVDPESLRCERPTPDCSSDAAINLSMIVTQIDAAVEAGAFDYGRVYGVDSRPVDGQILSIQWDNQELLVGDLSPKMNDCVRPDAAKRLAELLLNLGADMEMNTPACANLADSLN